jgi:hypothetical protein
VKAFDGYRPGPRTAIDPCGLGRQVKAFDG